MRRLSISLSTSRTSADFVSLPFLSSHSASSLRSLQHRRGLTRCYASSRPTRVNRVLRQKATVNGAGAWEYDGNLLMQCTFQSRRHFFVTAQPKAPPNSGLAEARQEPESSNQVLVDGTGNESQGPGSGKDYRPPTERVIKLGKTIRVLRTRLPTLLTNPLPPEILSPQITLRLFPSTHPNLPIVTGKVAYTAALWTSPVAWGGVPVVGNTRLEILSERMVGNDTSANSQGGEEKLVVRWKTGRSAATTNGGSSLTDMFRKMLNVLGGDSDGSPSRQDGDFHGLFIFEFDEEGRILTHTIEHVEQGNVWERTAKVISVTDWLLGKGWRKEPTVVPKLAFCGKEMHDIEKNKSRN